MKVMEITGLGLHIKVKDIQASRALYESLGFTPVFAYGDADFLATIPSGTPNAPEHYRGVAYKAFADEAKTITIAELEIAEDHIALKNKQDAKETIASAKISAMLRVKSLVPLFSNTNVNLVFPVRHYYWGTIEAAFRDPDGFVVVCIAPFSQEELDAVSKLTSVEEIKPQ